MEGSGPQSTNTATGTAMMPRMLYDRATSSDRLGIVYPTAGSAFRASPTTRPGAVIAASTSSPRVFQGPPRQADPPRIPVHTPDEAIEE